MAKSRDQLAAEIATTLRGIIHVLPLEGDFVMARPEFWERCTLINPNLSHLRQRISDQAAGLS
jgi:hypothetical protein